MNWEIARQVAGYVALDGADDRAARRPPTSARSSTSSPAPRRATSSPRPGSTSVLGLRTQRDRPREWVDLHLDALRPVLEALAVTLRKALEDGDDDEPTELGRTASAAATRSGANPFGVRRPVGGATRSAGCSRCSPRCCSACRPARWSATSRQHALGRYDLPLPDRRRAEPRVRRAEPRRVRGGVVDRPPRPALRGRAARGGARGRAVGAVGARAAGPAAIEYVSAYEVRPARVRGPVRRARPERPVVVRRDRRAPRGAARRDAVRPPARDPRRACRR